MLYRIAADALVLLHLLFILYVTIGGFLVFYDKRAALAHLPVVCWGSATEFFGWICPLTPLENRLRILGGQQGYGGGFIEHYLLPVLYPEGLTRGLQVVLGVAALGINLAIYGFWLMQRKKHDKNG